MKAINFIEYYKNQLDLLNADKEKGWHFVNNTERAYNFFSQSFKPELIEKYFEGVSHRVWDNVDIFNSDKFCIDICGGSDIYYKVEESEYESEMQPLPKTLDNFISNCQNHGINLTFNKTAIQKLNIHELKGENQSHEQ